jgi:uncharacterized membrane protein YgcG
LVTSYTRKRRVATFGVVVFIGLVLAVSGGLVAYWSLHTERIRHYGVDIAVQEDGTALVRETVDYDFGANDRHGITRDFPGYALPGTEPAGAATGAATVTDVRVRSATAPDDVALSDDVHVVIRVGDPDRTVSGLHRYVLEYRITGVVSGDRLAYDAIGTGWSVPIDAADIRLTAPYRLSGVGCFQGFESGDTPCVASSGGDAVTTHVAGLEERQGVTLDGDRAGALSGPARTALPDDVDLSGGDSGRPYTRTLWLVLGAGGAGFVVGAVPAALWARRAGRDRAWAGGGIDAVFGGPGLESAPITDLDAERQVTIQFEPPRDLTPAQGGVLLSEQVSRDHQVAWLTQQSIDGWFRIENDGKRLRWTAPEDRWASAPTPLQKMFNRRAKIKLGRYDQRFAVGFRMVADELKDWRRTCELWDHDAERRNNRVSSLVKTLSVVAVLAGAVALFMTASAEPDLAYLTAAVSALFAGAGVSMAMSARELPIRTPEGFARRQLVEGFRRFFVASEGQHARAAAERDELRLYSAWAVALGELDHWHKAVAAAQLPPDTSGVSDTVGFVALSSTVQTATSAPSSGSSGGSSGGSSSGGGYSGGGYSGGGDVGGGGGGGGGGSW